MKLFSHFSANGVELEPKDFPRENIMEAYIQENPSVLGLQDGDEVRVLDNQVDWFRNIEGTNSKGRIDLLALYNNSTLAIVELKVGALEEKDFDQLKSYFGVKDHLNAIAKEVGEKVGGKPLTDWMGVLVGTGLSEGFSPVVDKGVGYPCSVAVLKRFKSESQTFVASHVVLLDKKGKDYTKYSLDGSGCYSKNRLVLALVKKYVARAGVTKESVETNLFKGVDSLSAIPDIIERNRIQEKYEGYYFLKPDELVTINGVDYAVSSWWSINSLPPVLENAKRLNFNIEPVKEK